MRTAESILIRVEQLNAVAIQGQSPGEELARWLARQSGVLYDRLVAVGLAAASAPAKK